MEKKEAMEILKDFHDKSALFSVRTALDTVLPELGESEDKRMWKLIKKYAHSNISDMALNADHITRKQLESWLEKQDKQDVRYKHLEELLAADDIYQMSMNKDMVEEAKTKAINALSQLCISELLFEKQDEQKPFFNIGDTIIKKHNSDINKFGQFTITDITGGKYWYNDRIICDINEQNDWELVEQKPAWSEDDERMFNYALDMIEWYGGGYEEKARNVSNWLKSLKQRLQ